MLKSGSRRSFPSEFQTVGPTTATARRLYAKAMAQRVGGGWPNEGAVVRRIRQPACTARTGSPVRGLN